MTGDALDAIDKMSHQSIVNRNYFRPKVSADTIMATRMTPAFNRPDGATTMLPTCQHRHFNEKTKRGIKRVGVKEGDNTQMMSIARSRRLKENQAFDDLNATLPFPPGITMQLDKAGTVRLACQYMKLIDFLPIGLRSGELIANEQADVELRDLGSCLMQSLEGFVFMCTDQGTVMYITEPVSVHLGMSQHELIGNPLLHFVHNDDRQSFLHTLTFTEADQTLAMHAPIGHTMAMDKAFCVRLRCTLVKRNAGLTDNGHKAVHCNGYQFLRRTNDGIENLGLLAIGCPLPPNHITELLLPNDSFIIHTDMALKITAIDDTTGNVLGFEPFMLVGHSLYTFLDAADVLVVGDAHNTARRANQATSGYYRFMSNNGASIYVQTQFMVYNVSSDEARLVLVNNVVGRDNNVNSPARALSAVIVDEDCALSMRV